MISLRSRPDLKTVPRSCQVLPLSIDDMKKKGDELVAKFKEATKM